MRTAALLLSFALTAGCGAKIVGPMSTSPERFAQIDLAARVKTALLNDTVVGERAIDVTATAGQVTLIGRVRTTNERDRAVAIAKGVQGVRGVTDRLEIVP